MYGNWVFKRSTPHCLLFLNLQLQTMTLIKSISGIRGTIGGKPGDALTPIDAVKFAASYGLWIVEQSGNPNPTVVIGRDARPSGHMISSLVSSTLSGVGVNVVDLGLSTTPTVEVMVPELHADGGIILTASHNPKQWNALKLLNNKGEFLSGANGKEILDRVISEDFDFADVDDLGTYTTYEGAIDLHIQQVLDLPTVNVEAIKKAGLRVAVDGVNSTGGIAIPALLKALGVEQIEALYCEPNGQFPHNPEPLAEHLGDIMKHVVETGCDVGVVVDPDVDRLALISEDGNMFGEEYTLVLVADYLLSKTPGNTVSNLSSSRALADITHQHGGQYEASAVGEVNVVEKMKATQAVIGGEGNGGVIYPALHYGRDSLVGVALVLSHLAETGKKMSQLKASYPTYFMAKKKAQLVPGIDVDALLTDMAVKFANEKVDTIDGVKIDFDEGWVHLRKSNTEPIVRVYTEAPTQEKADALGDRFLEEIVEVMK